MSRWRQSLETLNRSFRFHPERDPAESWHYGSEDLRELFSIWLLDSIARNLSVYYRGSLPPIASGIAPLREKANEIDQHLRNKGRFFSRDSSIAASYKTMLVRSQSYGQQFHEQFRAEMTTSEALELMRRIVANWDWDWFWKHHRR